MGTFESGITIPPIGVAVRGPLVVSRASTETPAGHGVLKRGGRGPAKDVQAMTYRRWESKIPGASHLLVADAFARSVPFSSKRATPSAPTIKISPLVGSTARPAG